MFGDRPWNIGNNPMTTVRQFLEGNRNFEIDTEIHNKLLITVAPNVYLDISQQDMSRRISLLACAIAAGCSLVFWGIRRRDQLLESLKCQHKLHFQSSQELIDQILLAYQDKIKICNVPMLLRDETNLEYVFTEDRQDHFNYFPPEEYQLLLGLLEGIGGEGLARAATAFTDMRSITSL